MLDCFLYQICKYIYLYIQTKMLSPLVIKHIIYPYIKINKNLNTIKRCIKKTNYKTIIYRNQTPIGRRRDDPAQNVMKGYMELIEKYKNAPFTYQQITLIACEQNFILTHSLFRTKYLKEVKMYRWRHKTNKSKKKQIVNPYQALAN